MYWCCEAEESFLLPELNDVDPPDSFREETVLAEAELSFLGITVPGFWTGVVAPLAVGVA